MEPNTVLGLDQTVNGRSVQGFSTQEECGGNTF
jgi:hypothetical protein